ncbi:MAG: hypothetical protein U0R23_10985 [Candidatus Nanopelagicales bacterium]
MSMPRPAMTLAALIGVSLLPLTLAPPAGAVPMKGGKQTVTGKLTWTIVTTVQDEGDPSDLSRVTHNDTTEENHTLTVKAVRDPKFTRTYVFKMGKAPYSYTYTSNRLSRDYTFGQVSCESTTVANASGSGKTDLVPSIFGKYNGNKDVLVIDKRTKGISVRATLPGQGTSTSTYQDFGSGACGGTFTDPLDQVGSTTLNDSRNVCLPAGLKRPPSGYQPLYGKWNNKKKSFAFDCKQTFVDGYTTTRLTVSGTLKYKR